MIGETISHYRVVAELGAGGMGVVYKAEDLRLGRIVALKFLPPALMQDAQARQRFIQEARAASTLDHANVCTIHDIEETADGRIFLSMAYCDGETLKQRLERGPLPPNEAARVALQIARGLARAHQLGIVHRDVKPSNMMLTPKGEAKLLDFGIAKLRGGSDLTRTGTTVGTVEYMAPEQMRGGDADERSDVWALGVVFYEMIAGRRPFEGQDNFELLNAIVGQPVPPLAGIPGFNADLERVVLRCLEKDPARRYANASELAEALEASTRPAVTAAAATVTTPLRYPRSRRRTVLIGIAVTALLASAVAWWSWQSSRARWARNVALPEISRLADQDQYGEAFVLATQAEPYLKDDPVLAALWSRISRDLPVTSDPPGAEVSFRLIGKNTTWHRIGRTPIDKARLPRGASWWRFNEGGTARELLRSTEHLPRLEGVALPASGWPDDMVPVDVPLGLRLTLTAFDFNVRYPAKGYFIDRHEVTNAEFKAFVDAGGYEKSEYWTEPFVQDGRVIDHAQAMTLFRDATGRPGPSTWQGGTFPEGHEDYPVSGVSWYEAAAYAAFRHKHLPTIYHWTYAAEPELGVAVTRSSNFGGVGPVPVGTAPGLGPYGTVDMAGNVREWVWNESGGGKRYILGGAWSDPDYQFLFPDTRPPFDRSDANGFRCMKYADGDGPTGTLMAVIAPRSRDYATERPVADDVHRIYSNQYKYDPTPLEDRLESSDDQSPHWRHELVSIAAPYGGERIPIHLYLPKNVKPPYQAVLYFPGSGAIGPGSIANFSTFPFEFVVMSGRAVVYPVYKFTYERSDPRVTSSWPETTRTWAAWIQQLVTDGRRAIDLVEKRGDIDATRVAYYGVSWGAQMGPILLDLEPRLKTGILAMGGLLPVPGPPEGDPFNFASHVKVPILMLNGDQDFIFPDQTLQLPLFNMLGTPAADKQHVLYDGGHDIMVVHRSQIVQAIVGWLDRYLGRVE